MTKKEALRLLETAVKSCEEGKSGEWDVSTDEGKEGFDDIAHDLLLVMSYIESL